MEGLHYRLTVLWRQQEWSCEYVSDTAESARGVVILHMGSVVALRHAALTLHEVLRVSSFWREVIVGREGLQSRGQATSPSR